VTGPSSTATSTIRPRLSAASIPELDPSDRIMPAVLREERVLDARRLARVLPVAAVLWLFALLPGALLEPRAQHGGVADFVVVVLLGGAPLLAVITWLRREGERAGDARFDAARALAFLAPALGIGALAALHPDLRVPLGHALLIVIAVRGAACPMPWRKALPLVGAIGATFVASLVVGALVSEAGARALLDAGERATTLQVLAACVAGAALALAMGDVDWRLRRAAVIARHRSRYRLEARIGHGGMGEVWRAFHPGLGRDVALKVLRATYDPDLGKRFAREIAATARLSHPNTVRVLDCGLTDDGLPYFAMELLEGATLGAVMRTHDHLPPARAVFLVEQAARAIGEAHASGLVHRDVKPENVFLTSQGGEHDFVKVLDFGVVRDARDPDAITRVGVIVGTPRFMAPEQLLELPSDARTDVYALGLVLYYALTGIVPFGDESAAAMLYGRSEGVIDPPSLHVVGIPPALDTIALRCLHPSPDRRFADANELAAALAATGLGARWRPAPLEALPARRAAPDASTVPLAEEAR
jgi:serine/threonine-protein kinase